jgi:alanyl-tRNA synthetase
MNSADIRAAFLNYFEERGHKVVASSSLIPVNDPSLLFTNAGMVQFKEVFLGLETLPYKRAVSSQRCVRAGGKHNDLDNVGYTARHHTFFEMLGNFSFGDYFKREAISYAWELLTDEFAIDPARLWVTVYRNDDEAADIWLNEIKVDPARFARCGEEDNFWTMGSTGPCGPCTEIFYDHGPDIGGGPPGTADQEGDRYVEIWNLVFTQFDRGKDGVLNPIPRPSVDTGMGLERIAAVMQGVHSNYDIDLFRELMDAITDLAGPGKHPKTALQVISDHIRSSAFIIADGVTPSNEGRGYVLRRIIRRAIRHGFELGFREPFFYQLVDVVDRQLGDAHPILRDNKARVADTLRQEEVRFGETVEQGMKHFQACIGGLSGKVIPGDQVFKLKDTYGFPEDLTADLAREHGLGIDWTGFEAALAKQREQARTASEFHGMQQLLPAKAVTALSEGQRFTGYEHMAGIGRVTGLFRDGQPVERLAAGEAGVVVLDATPFYAESGGQVGDSGQLKGPRGAFQVEDTQSQGALHVHLGAVKIGELAIGDEVSAEVDSERRQRTVLNHSATHLLHAALRRVLGEHVQQKGSLVAPDRLRFDFSHNKALTVEELRAIEDLVNQQIRANHEVDAAVMSMRQALDSGAMALFGEKYGEEVRVLRMGGFSCELCGGTHVRHTGDIGLMKIISEAGVAAGVRRIEAVTGAAAIDWIQNAEATLVGLARQLKSSPEGLAEKIAQLAERVRVQERELQSLKGRVSSQAGSDLAGQAEEIEGVNVLAAQIEGADAEALRDTLDQLKNKLGSAAVVLGSIEDGKVRLVAGVTKDMTTRLKAGDLVNHVAGQVGGRGGGRPDMAQAGGNQPDNLATALASVPAWVREHI